MGRRGARRCGVGVRRAQAEVRLPRGDDRAAFRADARGTSGRMNCDTADDSLPILPLFTSPRLLSCRFCRFLRWCRAHVADAGRSSSNLSRLAWVAVNSVAGTRFCRSCRYSCFATSGSADLAAFHEFRRANFCRLLNRGDEGVPGLGPVGATRRAPCIRECCRVGYGCDRPISMKLCSCHSCRFSRRSPCTPPAAPLSAFELDHSCRFCRFSPFEDSPRSENEVRRSPA